MTLQTTVVVSPHLDDAALAVGGFIAAETRAGRRVRVMTVYAGSAPAEGASGRRRIFGDVPTRLAEDDRALAVLGAEAERLPLPERLFREPTLPNSRYVFRTPTTVEGFTELPAVEKVFTDLLADPSQRVLAPLSVGHHIDHVEVAVAALRACTATEAWDRMAFYEDFYALSDILRRRHPVTRNAARHMRTSPSWAGIVLAGLVLLARGPAATEYGELDPGVSWLPEVRPVDATCEHLKLRAVAQYRSQLPALGGARGVAAMIRHSLRRHGGEILWLPHQKPAWIAPKD